MNEESEFGISPLQADGLNGQAAHALFAAIAQIGLALRESQEPVAQLGSLIAHVSQSLTALRSAPFATESAQARAARELIEQLHTDVFRGIQQLQFYDRLVQHLSRLQEYLIAVANELGSASAQELHGEFWNELHAKLRTRLISDEQRGLLDIFLTPEATTRVSAQIKRPELLAPGSQELF